LIANVDINQTTMNAPVVMGCGKRPLFLGLVI